MDLLVSVDGKFDACTTVSDSAMVRETVISKLFTNQEGVNHLAALDPQQ